MNNTLETRINFRQEISLNSKEKLKMNAQLLSKESEFFEKGHCRKVEPMEMNSHIEDFNKI